MGFPVTIARARAPPHAVSFCACVWGGCQARPLELPHLEGREGVPRLAAASALRACVHETKTAGGRAWRVAPRGKEEEEEEAAAEEAGVNGLPLAGGNLASAG